MQGPLNYPSTHTGRFRGRGHPIRRIPNHLRDAINKSQGAVGDGGRLSLEEGLALVFGLQRVLGVPGHVVTPRGVVLTAQMAVGTSERGDGKECDQDESQELHYRSRERVVREVSGV